MDNDGSRVEYTEFGEILVRAAAEIKGIGITNGYRASVSIEGRREGGLAWFTAFSHPHMNPLLLCANQEPNGRLGTYLYYDLLLFDDRQREGINEQKLMSYGSFFR